MHDPDQVFDALGLRRGDTFLDIGCGKGDYSIHAAGIVGRSGKVHALDVREDCVTELREESSRRGIDNIVVGVSDARERLPIDDGCVDICLMCTVLHVLDMNDVKDVLFSEVHRILRDGGRFFVIECKKDDISFGPPIQMRISCDELEIILRRQGFEMTEVIDLGFNYMARFEPL